MTLLAFLFASTPHFFINCGRIGLRSLVCGSLIFFYHFQCIIPFFHAQHSSFRLFIFATPTSIELMIRNPLSTLFHTAIRFSIVFNALSNSSCPPLFFFHPILIFPFLHLYPFYTVWYFLPIEFFYALRKKNYCVYLLSISLSPVFLFFQHVLSKCFVTHFSIRTLRSWIHLVILPLQYLFPHLSFNHTIFWKPQNTLSLPIHLPLTLFSINVLWRTAKLRHYQSLFRVAFRISHFVAA